MIVKEFTVNQFRCFSEKKIACDGRIVIVQGANGSGKSSLLEALHYACYLRSFRTHLQRDLIKLGNESFFVHVTVAQEEIPALDQIHIGFSGAEGKTVSCNHNAVQSYKELIAHLKVVTLSADDIFLVQGEPEVRRDFLNYAMLLQDPQSMPLFKRFKTIVGQRNSLLAAGYGDKDQLMIWTEKLWEESRAIRSGRKDFLQLLENDVNTLLQTYFQTSDGGLSVAFAYHARNIQEDETFAEFWQRYEQKLVHSEYEMRRSLFGAHLDDFIIQFQQKKARAFASRGQQKLLALLIKVAQLAQLSRVGEPGVLLLDDFVTDFDYTRMQHCVAALKDLKYQMFISCPEGIRAEVFDALADHSDVVRIDL